MRKVDLKKELKQLYQASAKDVLAVDVPAFQFLMIDGEGDPNTSAACASRQSELRARAWNRRTARLGWVEPDLAPVALDAVFERRAG